MASADSDKKVIIAVNSIKTKLYSLWSITFPGF
jgi:hypothetical protein